MWRNLTAVSATGEQARAAAAARADTRLAAFSQLLSTCSELSERLTEKADGMQPTHLAAPGEVPQRAAAAPCACCMKSSETEAFATPSNLSAPVLHDPTAWCTAVPTLPVCSCFPAPHLQLEVQHALLLLLHLVSSLTALQENHPFGELQAAVQPDADHHLVQPEEWTPEPLVFFQNAEQGAGPSAVSPSLPAALTGSEPDVHSGAASPSTQQQQQQQQQAAEADAAHRALVQRELQALLDHIDQSIDERSGAQPAPHAAAGEHTNPSCCVFVLAPLPLLSFGCTT